MKRLSFASKFISILIIVSFLTSAFCSCSINKKADDSEAAGDTEYVDLTTNAETIRETKTADSNPANTLYDRPEELTILEEDGVKISIIVSDVIDDAIPSRLFSNEFKATLPDGKSGTFPVKWCGFAYQKEDDSVYLDWEPRLYLSDVTGDGTGDIIVIVPETHGVPVYIENITVLDGITLQKYDIEDVTETFFDHIDVTLDLENKVYHVGTTTPTDVTFESTYGYNWDKLTQDEKQDFIDNYAYLDTPDVTTKTYYSIVENEIVCGKMVWTYETKVHGFFINIALKFNGESFIYDRSWITAWITE